MNELVFGSSQSGKSTGVLLDIEQRLWWEDIVVVILDPQAESTGRKALSILPSRRTVYDSMADFDSPLPIDFLPRGNERENRLTIETMTDILCDIRGIDDIYTRPVLHEGAERVMRAMISHDRRLTFDEGKWLLDPRHPDFPCLIDGTRPSERYWFENLSKHPDFLERKTQPPFRLINDFASSPVIQARDRPGRGFDFAAALDDGYHLVVEAGWGTPYNDIRILLRTIFHRIIRYKMHGGGRHVVVIVEEASAFRLIGPREVRAIQTLQKRGFDVIIICQSPIFG